MNSSSPLRSIAFSWIVWGLLVTLRTTDLSTLSEECLYGLSKPTFRHWKEEAIETQERQITIRIPTNVLFLWSKTWLFWQLFVNPDGALHQSERDINMARKTFKFVTIWTAPRKRAIWPWPFNNRRWPPATLLRISKRWKSLSFQPAHFVFMSGEVC